jgi:hypothetical protein
MKIIKFKNDELIMIEKALVYYILMDHITLKEAKELKELYIKIK